VVSRYRSEQSRCGTISDLCNSSCRLRIDHESSRRYSLPHVEGVGMVGDWCWSGSAASVCQLRLGWCLVPSSCSFREVLSADGEGSAILGARRARGGEATRFGCACEILSIWDDQVNTRRLTKAVVCRCWTSIERV